MFVLVQIHKYRLDTDRTHTHNGSTTADIKHPVSLRGEGGILPMHERKSLLIQWFVRMGSEIGQQWKTGQLGEELPTMSMPQSSEGLSRVHVVQRMTTCQHYLYIHLLQSRENGQNKSSLDAKRTEELKRSYHKRRQSNK